MKFWVTGLICLILGIMGQCGAFAANDGIKVLDITYDKGQIIIEYSNTDNTDSKIIIAEYDKNKKLLFADIKDLSSTADNNQIKCSAGPKAVEAMVYTYREDEGFKKIASQYLKNISEAPQIPDTAKKIYNECYVHKSYIGGMSKGYYDVSGNFIENDKGYASQIFNASGMTISVATYYHWFEIDVLTKVSDGRYKIKKTQKETYTFGDNDCAFMIVNSDGSPMNDKTINTINQTLRLSSEVYIDNSNAEVDSENSLTELAATKFTVPFTLWSDEDKNNNYECWPFSNSWYDESDDSVNIVYTAGSDHLSYIGKFAIYYRKIYADNTVSKAVPIAQSNDIGYNVTSSAILSDGTYAVAIINKEDSTLHLYKSKDKGKTWQDNNIQFKDETDCRVTDITGLYQCTDNRLLGFAKLSDKLFRIAESNDGGLTWHFITETVDKSVQALEGAFVKLSGQRMICIMRGVLGQHPYNTQFPTYMIKSEDNGHTWSDLIELVGMDATCNPVAALYHADNATIEMLYGSRYAREDYCGSINQMVVAEEDLWNGDLSNTHELRLYKAPATRDFGYFTMAQTKDGTIKAFFYSGHDAYANIYCMIGR